MNLINFIKQLFKPTTQEVKDIVDQGIYSENEVELPKTKEKTEIVSIWDVINCNEHTQAYHLVSVIPYDEWIDMNEIQRRIWDLFQIEYKNERSLYPYLKTMVDLGLIETSNIGGRRKWRKKDLLIKLSEQKKVKETIEQKISA
ncbi:MAG: hypothetical protein HOC95_01035 [Candidatus Diapherotrites archaeon]|nr:hypothetical protein [Candidatus Diapherotrites archaeon]